MDDLEFMANLGQYCTTVLCISIYAVYLQCMVDLVSLLHHKQNVRASSVCLSFGHQRYFPYDGMVGRIPYNPKDVSVYVLCSEYGESFAPLFVSVG